MSRFDVRTASASIGQEVGRGVVTGLTAAMAHCIYKQISTGHKEQSWPRAKSMASIADPRPSASANNWPRQTNQSFTSFSPMDQCDPSSKISETREADTKVCSDTL